MNLIINLDHEDWILNDKNKTLAEYGVGELGLHLYLCNKRITLYANYDCCCSRLVVTVNETELSLFNRELYEAFKEHPDVSV
jgi:hypothetical protein